MPKNSDHSDSYCPICETHNGHDISCTTLHKGCAHNEYVSCDACVALYHQPARPEPHEGPSVDVVGDLPFRAHTGKWIELLTPLIQHPGKWARITIPGATRLTYNGLVAAINHKKALLPPGIWRAAERRGCAYVCYCGPEPSAASGGKK